jgi:hypothetical protein
MDKHSHMDHQPHAPEHHIASLGMYFGVFFALLILTVVTVAVSRVDLGAMNTLVGPSPSSRQRSSSSSSCTSSSRRV